MDSASSPARPPGLVQPEPSPAPLHAHGTLSLAAVATDYATKALAAPVASADDPPPRRYAQPALAPAFLSATPLAQVPVSTAPYFDPQVNASFASSLPAPVQPVVHSAEVLQSVSAEENWLVQQQQLLQFAAEHEPLREAATDATDVTEQSAVETPANAGAAAAKPVRRGNGLVLYTGPVYVDDEPVPLAKTKLDTLLTYLRSHGGTEVSLHDWSVYVSQRLSGDTKGTLDVYFIDPTGKKCRSKVDVAKYFKLIKTPEPEQPRVDVPAAASTTAMASPSPTTTAFQHSSAAESPPQVDVAKPLFRPGTSELLEPIQCGTRVTVISVGAVEPASVVVGGLYGNCVYPTGYTAHTVFPSPLTPHREGLYECTIATGPVFRIRYVGDTCFKKGQEPCHSGLDTAVRLTAEGASPNEAWEAMVTALEARYARMCENAYAMSSTDDNSATSQVRDALDALERAVENKLDLERITKTRFFHTDVSLHDMFGDVLFGFVNPKVMQACEALPGVPSTYVPKVTRPKRIKSQDATHEFYEKKIDRAIFRLQADLDKAEKRGELAARRRMKKLDSGARDPGDQAPAKQPPPKSHRAKSAAAPKKQLQELEKKKRDARDSRTEKEMAMLSIGDARLALKHAKTTAARQELLEALSMAEGYWKSDDKPDDAALRLAPFSPIGDRVNGTADLVTAWDFVSSFAVILGLCPAPALDCHALAETRHATDATLLVLSPKAAYSSAIKLDEFVKAFYECDEHVMGPVHVALLRATVSALKATLSSEDPRENVFGEVQNGGHLLINGAPVCDATWFELVKQITRPDGFFTPVPPNEPAPKACAETVLAELLSHHAHAAQYHGPPKPADAADDSDDDDGDSILGARLQPSAPEWLTRLMEVDSIPSSRGAKIRDLIAEVLKTLPKDESAVKGILNDALKRYKSNAAGPMKTRVARAVKQFLGARGIDQTAETSILVARESTRSMTPGESANCIMALDTTMKKTKRLAVELKEVDQKLRDSQFPSAAAFLEAVDAVWDKNRGIDRGYTGADTLQKAREEFRLALMNHAPEVARGGPRPIVVTSAEEAADPRRMVVEKSSSSSRVPVPQGELVGSILGNGAVVVGKDPLSAVLPDGTPVPVSERDVVGAPPAAAVATAAEPLWARLAKAQTYAELDVATREQLLMWLVGHAQDAPAVVDEIEGRLQEMKETRRKYGHPSWLRHLSLQDGNRTQKSSAPVCEEFLEEAMARNKRQLDVVSMFALDRVVKDLKQAVINRDVEAFLLPYRTAVEKVMRHLDPHSFVFGFDRADRLYVHFAGDMAAVQVFDQAGNVYRLSTTQHFNALFHVLDERGFRESRLVKTLKAWVPQLTGALPDIVLRARVKSDQAETDKLDKEKPLDDVAAVLDGGGAPATAPAPKEPTEDELWLRSGPYVGERVARTFEGRVTQGWVVRYMKALGPEDPALWRVEHMDGDREDLEEHELLPALAAAASPVLMQCASAIPYFPNTHAAKVAGKRLTKRLLKEASFGTADTSYEGRVLVDMKVVLLCCERVMRLGVKDWEKQWPSAQALKVWTVFVKTCATWRGLRQALAVFESALVPTKDVKLLFASHAGLDAAMRCATFAQLACRILFLDSCLKFSVSPTDVADADLDEPLSVEPMALSSNNKRAVSSPSPRPSAKQAKLTAASDEGGGRGQRAKRKAPAVPEREAPSRTSTRKVAKFDDDYEDDDEEEMPQRKSKMKAAARITPRGRSLESDNDDDDDDDEEEDAAADDDDDDSDADEAAVGAETEEDDEVASSASLSSAVEDDEDDGEEDELDVAPRATTAASRKLKKHASSTDDSEGTLSDTARPAPPSVARKSASASKKRR